MQAVLLVFFSWLYAWVFFFYQLKASDPPFESNVDSIDPFMIRVMKRPYGPST